jgi:uncharacterized membrane protein YgdD (TMEM256/DUF423 family)
MVVAWETAVRYQLIHAVAMFSSLAWQSSAGRIQSAHTKWLVRANGCWTVGLGLFCGSLYGLALGGPHWLGPITPLGGFALLGGWSCVAIQAWTFAPAEKT